MRKRILSTLLLLVILVVSYLGILHNNKNSNKGDIEFVEKEVQLVEDTIDEETNEEQQITYITGWTRNTVNIHKEPNIDSEVIGTLSFNQPIEYYTYDSAWGIINYTAEQLGYITLTSISDSVIGHTDHSISVYKDFKSYMKYTAITSKSSPQYKLQQNFAYTGNFGIRQVNGRYCIALGTAFTTSIGQYVDLILENGTVIPCILADVKANQHTNGNNTITSHNGCATEFIVDKNQLHSTARKMGSISYCCDEWKSKVVTIRVYDINVFNM